MYAFYIINIVIQEIYITCLHFTINYKYNILYVYKNRNNKTFKKYSLIELHLVTKSRF